MKLIYPENTYLTFLLLVFMVLGFLGTNYYLKHESWFSAPLYSTDEILRTRALSHRLHHVEYQNAHLESQVAELKLKTAELYNRQSFSKAHRLAGLIGLIQQEGPGVEIWVKDSNKPLRLGDNANAGIVHNTDLLQIINELRSAGATAIAVNNQPILNMTSITCSGPIIMINGTRIASPFVIVAIGEPEALMKPLQDPSSFVNELKSYGIEVTLTPRQTVVVPASTQELAVL